MRENLAGRSYEGVVEPVKQAPHPQFLTVLSLPQQGLRDFQLLSWSQRRSQHNVRQGTIALSFNWSLTLESPLRYNWLWWRFRQGL